MPSGGRTSEHQNKYGLGDGLQNIYGDQHDKQGSPNNFRMRQMAALNNEPISRSVQESEPLTDTMPNRALFPKDHFMQEISGINGNTQLPMEPSVHYDVAVLLTGDDMPTLMFNP